MDEEEEDDRSPLEYLLDSAREFTLGKLTGFDYQYLGEVFIHAYSGVRARSESFDLSDSERKQIRMVLPSEALLAEIGFQFFPDIVSSTLGMRSTVAFLTDDFPHLWDLNYHEDVLRMNELIAGWKSSTDGKYSCYFAFDCVRRQFSGAYADRRYPRTHTWWDITSHVLTINGKSLEEAEQDHIRRLALRQHEERQ